MKVRRTLLPGVLVAVFAVMAMLMLFLTETGTARATEEPMVASSVTSTSPLEVGTPATVPRASPASFQLASGAIVVLAADSATVGLASDPTTSAGAPFDPSAVSGTAVSVLTAADSTLVVATVTALSPLDVDILLITGSVVDATPRPLSSESGGEQLLGAVETGAAGTFVPLLLFTVALVVFSAGALRSLRLAGTSNMTSTDDFQRWNWGRPLQRLLKPWFHERSTQLSAASP